MQPHVLERRRRERARIAASLSAAGWRTSAGIPDEVSVEMEYQSPQGMLFEAEYSRGRALLELRVAERLTTPEGFPVPGRGTQLVCYVGGRLARALRTLVAAQDAVTYATLDGLVDALTAVCPKVFRVSDEGATVTEVERGAGGAARYTAGNVPYERGRWLEALAHYEEATARDPGLAEAWHNRGRTLLALERDAEAERALRRAVRLYGVASRLVTDAGVRAEWVYWRGLAYALLADRARALRDLGRALALAPALRRFVAQEPDLRALRDDPAVVALLGGAR